MRQVLLLRQVLLVRQVLLLRQVLLVLLVLLVRQVLQQELQQVLQLFLRSPRKKQSLKERGK